MFNWQEIVEQTKALGGAVLVHLLMAALVVLGTMSWKPFREPEPVGLTIEAVIVDTSEIKKQRDAAHRAQELEERKQRREEALRQQREREADEAEAERQRQQRIEEQRKQDAADRLQALRMERERKMEEERVKQERELDEIRRQREAAERERKIEEERLKQIEARRQREQQQEQQRLAAEADAQRKQAEEAAAFRAGRVAELADNYRAALQNHVTANWRRPMSTQPGLECRLRIIQIPGGEVIDAAIVNPCNGDDATRRSVLNAVERGGALPYRGFEEAFEREIEFTFIYNGD